MKAKTNFYRPRLTGNTGGLGRGMAATLGEGTARKPVHVNACEPCTIAGKEVTARKDGTNSMKAKTKRAARLPRARVMWANAGGVPVQSFRMFDDDVPAAVIPCWTLKRAQAWVRLAGMSEEQLRELIDNKTPYSHRAYLESITYRDGINAALSALGIGDGGGR